MKTLIAYMSTHGCTRKIAGKINEKLEGDTTIVNLKKDEIPLLTEFDMIIIGGSIHAGQIQKRVKDFCKNNIDVLKTKDIGLYICCMEEGEKAQEQLQDAFPEDLLQHAKSTAIAGGEFNFDRMSFVEKLIIKKVAKVSEPVSKINHSSIDKFISDMQKIFNPFLFLA